MVKVGEYPKTNTKFTHTNGDPLWIKIPDMKPNATTITDKPMIDKSRLQDYDARDPNVVVKIYELIGNYVFGIYKDPRCSYEWKIAQWNVSDGEISGIRHKDSEDYDLILKPREWSEDIIIFRPCHESRYYNCIGNFRETDGKTELVSVEVVK